MKNYRYDFGICGTFRFDAETDVDAVQCVKKEAIRLQQKGLTLHNAINTDNIQVVQNGGWVYLA